MRLRFILFIIFIINSFGYQAIAQQLKSVKPSETEVIGLRNCATRSPGSVSYGPIVGQSNDGRPDTIFLCYQDQISIKNNGDGDFNTGDPDPLTPSAAGFLLYGAPPTVNGNTFAAIQADNVLSNPPPPPGELWYFMGTPNGDITLYNDGSVNQWFNAGSPFTLYLAPATFDAYTVSGGEYFGQYEGGGSCVKVNTSSAFPVVYLNEISMDNFTTPSPTTLSGSFFVNGGFPEFKSNARYTVTIVKKGNPGQVANIFGGPFSHGSKVSFAVPSAGTYIVTILDGKNCGITQEIVMPQGNVSVLASSGSVAYNDDICIDFTVKDFKDLLGGEFAIGFNPNDLQYTNITFPAANPLNLSINGNFGLTEVANGYINFAWTDPNLSKKTLPDNTIIFSVCFKAIGKPGTQTPVIIKPKKNGAFEFTDYDGTFYSIKNTNGIVTITNPTDLQVFFNVCSTTGNTGSITFTAFGPDAQYNYDINNSGATNIADNGVSVTINNLTPGTHVVDVFTTSGVHVITNVQVLNAPPIIVTPTITNPKCVNSSDGAIQLSINGGNQPYAIEWSNFTFNTTSVSNLNNGVYQVTITDNTGCVFSENFTINTTPMAINPPTIVDPACSGQTSGSITVSASGGNPFTGNVYDYSWSYNNIKQNKVATGTLTNIPEGVYSLTVTDANGCEAVSNFTLKPGVTIDATVIKQLPVCYGDGKGKLTITGTTNGTTTGPYTFTWSPNAVNPVNNATSSIVSGLNNGNFTVTVSDANGCFVKKDYTIDGPGEIKFLISGLKDDECGTQPKGAALIFDGSGNTTPFPDPNNPGSGFYRFTWSNGSNPTTVDAVSLNLTNLMGSGSGIRYYVTITGADGCTADTSFLIFKKDAPKISFDTVHTIACAGGNDGIIKANITTNGSEIATVFWSNNAGIPVNGGDPKTTYTSTISNLNGGDYIITITTLSGCTVTDTVTLTGQGSLSIDNNVIVPSKCPDSKDGSITLSSSGGTPPYVYQWSNGQSGDVASNLLPGTYTVTVSDQSGCPPFTQTFTVGHAPSVVSVIDKNTVVASDCYDAVVGTGGANVSASGGQASTYTFTWSSGESNTGASSNATALKGGWQYVSISDGVCTVVDSVQIPSPDPISTNKASSTIVDATCFGDTDGSISFTTSGGNGGYNYQWNPTSSNSANITGLTAATYYVTITDSKNCIGIDSFKVKQPLVLAASLDTAQSHDLLCYDDNTGAIYIKTSGGNGNYSYTWNPSVAGNSDNASNLSAGNYLITIADKKGCNTNLAVTLREPSPLRVDYDQVPEPQCAGYDTNFELNSITGGTGPDYSYTIDNGKSYSTFEIAKVKGGKHLLTIIDENGCRLDTSFIVNEPAPILVNLPEEIKLDLGDTITLSPTVQSAFPISSTSWFPPQAVSCSSCDRTEASVISSQYVTVLLTDANGCTGLDSVFLKVDRSRKVFIPNAFSPNKDGINDIFQIYTGPGVVGINYLRVFDRFGGLMFEKNNMPPNENGSDQGWDGAFKGEVCNPGVFTYVAEVKFIDGRTQLYFGSVTLIR
jgi:gliding motility-associated-like protein